MDSMKQDYNPFRSLVSVIENLHEDGCDVFVCHPGYLDDFIMKNSTLIWPRPLEVEMLCNQETKEYVRKSQVTLVSYDNI